MWQTHLNSEAVKNIQFSIKLFHDHPTEGQTHSELPLWVVAPEVIFLLEKYR